MCLESANLEQRSGPGLAPPEDVLLYYGAKQYGEGPPVYGERSPRDSYNPEAPNFSRERGSYQKPPEHP